MRQKSARSELPAQLPDTEPRTQGQTLFPEVDIEMAGAFFTTVPPRILVIMEFLHVTF